MAFRLALDEGVAMLRLASIQKLALFYLVIWTISPFMEVDAIWRILALAAAGIWFIFAIYRTGARIDRMQLFSIWFAIAVTLIAFLETGSVSGVLSQIAVYMVVIFYLMYRYYSGHWEELRGLVLVVLLLLIVFNLRSAAAVRIDPQIARSIVRDDEETYMYLRQGIGGYSLIYPQVVIFPAILLWTEKAFRKKLLFFIIGAVWLVSYVSYILIAGYAIAVYASILGVIVLHFYRGKRVVAVIFITLLLFAAGMYLLVSVPSVQSFLLKLFSGTAVDRKIEDAILSAESGTAQGTIYDRVSAYRYSLETILRYPIIGGLWWAGGGGHSAVLDMFAKYGILGGYMYVKMIYTVPQDYRREHPKELYRVCNGAFATMFFVTILDSCTYAFTGMMLIVLPVLLEDILRWSRMGHESSLDSKPDTGAIGKST